MWDDVQSLSYLINVMGLHFIETSLLMEKTTMTLRMPGNGGETGGGSGTGGNQGGNK